MSSQPNLTRENVVELIKQHPIELEPPTVAPAEDFVVAAGNSQRYVSTSFDVVGESVESSPRHWFFVVPHPTRKSGCYAVEFGIPNSDLTGVQPQEARFSQEFFVDTMLGKNKENPMV